MLGSPFTTSNDQFPDLYLYKEHMSSLKEALCDWMPAGYIFFDPCLQWKRCRSPLECLTSYISGRATYVAPSGGSIADGCVPICHAPAKQDRREDNVWQIR